MGTPRGRLCRRALCAAAIGLSFAMYVAAFEPFGAAELAYVFAVPALWAARALGLCPGFETRREYARDESAGEDDKRARAERRADRRTYLLSCFAFSYLAWVAILVWLRHVYPPAGWIALLALPLAISALFIFPWFALVPFFLPSLEDGIARRLAKLFGLAGIWVLLEWARTHMFSGFPWLLLGDSQWLRVPVIQSASYGGVWIVSFTLIFFNLAVEEYFYRTYSWYKFRLEGRFGKKVPFGKLSPEFYIALLLMLSGVWLYISEFPSKQNERGRFRAGFVQPDFAGILKWRDDLARENLKVVSRLVLALKDVGVDMIALPEAATPPKWPIIGTPAMREMMENLSKQAGVPLALGNMAWLEDSMQSQNGAFVIDPKTGLEEKYYAKTKLVPFGEYVPAWASWIGKVVPVGNMKRGDSFEPLEIKIRSIPMKMGCMICYEDVFAQIGRKAAKDADFLFVCTNDSWYGREGGAWQHAAHSALQAVALRKPIVRSSNNGLSCAFDQYGKMCPTTTLKNADNTAWRADSPRPARTFEISDARGRAIDPETLKPKRPSPMLDENNSIYFRGAGFADVPFYSNFDGAPSFYAKHGDWFVALCAAFAAFGCAALLFGGKKVRIEQSRQKSLNEKIFQLFPSHKD